MSDEPPTLFDGVTFEEMLDGTRLTRQLDAVRALMLDRQWRTLREIAVRVGGSEAGVSARLRDLRKPGHGSHTVHRRRRGDPTEGLFEYQLILNGAES